MKPQSSQIYVDGFPSLAAFIASDRDGSAAIFKRFSRLAARNLLVLQSELADLEARLDQMDEDDKKDLEAMQSLRNWEKYKERSKVEPERMELTTQLRKRMKEYSMFPRPIYTKTMNSEHIATGEALIFESTIARLESPDPKITKAFRLNFFHGRPEDKLSFPMLGGHSSSLYDDPDDLIALQVVEDSDKLTIFVRDHFGFMFQVSEQYSTATLSIHLPKLSC